MLEEEEELKTLGTTNVDCHHTSETLSWWSDETTPLDEWQAPQHQVQDVNIFSAAESILLSVAGPH